MKHSQISILNQIIKNGANPVDAKEMVEENYDYVIRTYKDSSVKELANIVTTLGR